MQVLALSSSRSGNGGFLENAAPLIGDFLGEKKLTVAFIPFASVERSYEDFGGMVAEALAHLPYKVVVAVGENARRVIRDADCVMVGGGNTFKLLHDLYELDLVEMIREKVKNGTPYIGWSAGANLTGLTICTTNDMPIIQPRSFDGLGFFSFQINPHYLNEQREGFHGETRDQRLGEFIRLHPKIPVVGLPEGTALMYRDEELRFVGEGGVVFSAGEDGSVKRSGIVAGADLRFLISEGF